MQHYFCKVNTDVQQEVGESLNEYFNKQPNPTHLRRSFGNCWFAYIFDRQYRR